MRKGFKVAALVAGLSLVPLMAVAQQIQLVHTITGMPLDLSLSPEEGRDTPAVKEFMKTGHNPYVGVDACMHEAEEMYLTACSGCHGHIGEGKLGPGLNDDYWTYPKNQTDQGLFETIYGGARSMMGPQASAMQMDEILLVIAWIRHLYKGDVEGAVWLTDEQKANFVPFDPDHHKPETEELVCEIPAQTAAAEATNAEKKTETPSEN